MNREFFIMWIGVSAICGLACGDAGDGDGASGGASTDTTGMTGPASEGSSSSGEAPTTSAGTTSGASGSATGTTGGPASVCSRDEYWTMGDLGSELMHPGMACLACHLEFEAELGARFLVGGTVYPTLHEPDDCFGLDGAAAPTTVEIKTADAQTLSLPVNAAGNFMYDASEFGPISFPITAKVIQGGKERVMASPQMSGDCNVCHTETGSQGAPGRIFAP